MGKKKKHRAPESAGSGPKEDNNNAAQSAFLTRRSALVAGVLALLGGAAAAKKLLLDRTPSEPASVPAPEAAHAATDIAPIKSETVTFEEGSFAVHGCAEDIAHIKSELVIALEGLKRIGLSYHPPLPNQVIRICSDPSLKARGLVNFDDNHAMMYGYSIKEFKDPKSAGFRCKPRIPVEIRINLLETGHGTTHKTLAHELSHIILRTTPLYLWGEGIPNAIGFLSLLADFRGHSSLKDENWCHQLALINHPFAAHDFYDSAVAKHSSLPYLDIAEVTFGRAWAGYLRSHPNFLQRFQMAIEKNLPYPQTNLLSEEGYLRMARWAAGSAEEFDRWYNAQECFKRPAVGSRILKACVNPQSKDGKKQILIFSGRWVRVETSRLDGKTVSLLDLQPGPEIHFRAKYNSAGKDVMTESWTAKMQNNDPFGVAKVPLDFFQIEFYDDILKQWVEVR